MSSVPTTETAVDRRQALKELDDKIAIVKSVKERAENDTKIALEGAAQAAKSAKELDEHIQAMKALIPEASREVREFMNTCAAMIKESAEINEEMRKYTAMLVDEAKKAETHLVHARRMAVEVHETALRETIIMDRQRDDLKIYEKRLRTYFDTYLPDQKIII